MADDTTKGTARTDPVRGQEAPPGEPVVCNIPVCCVATISEHVRFNPMMVCSSCKNIIKCFTEERAFQNYLTFCRSRRRTVLTGFVQHYWTVAFRSYDTFGR